MHSLRKHGQDARVTVGSPPPAFRLDEAAMTNQAVPIALVPHPSQHEYDHAATLRKRNNAFAPAVVLTGRQTAGYRGRGSNHLVVEVQDR